MIDPTKMTVEMLEFAADNSGYSSPEGPMFKSAKFLHQKKLMNIDGLKITDKKHQYVYTYLTYMFDYNEGGYIKGNVYVAYNHDRRCWCLEF